MNAGSIAPAQDIQRSFWRRRVVDPIVSQLKQGISPENISITIALGLVLGVFPVLGSTTLLCAFAAAWLRLNQPIIHLVNYAAYPLQIILLIPMYRMGEALFGREPVSLSIPLLFERFQADFGLFLKDFGLIAMQGIVVWGLLAPFAAALTYFSMRPALRLLAGRTNEVTDD